VRDYCLSPVSHKAGLSPHPSNLTAPTQMRLLANKSARGDSGGCADIDGMNPLAGQIDLMSRMMNAAETQHRVISHNIANVNTPGYRRLEVSFEDMLKHAKSGNSGQPIIREQMGLPERADGNNVDIDREVGALQKNAMAYQTYSQLMAAQLQLMRRAIET